MSTQPNPSGEVPAGTNPQDGNVAQGPKTAKDMGDQAALDIIAELASPTSTGAEPSAGAGEGQTENGGDVPPEKKEDLKPGDAPPEQKPNEDQPKPGEEPNKPEKPKDGTAPIATIGSQSFQNLEDLVRFAETQQGYNRWITGTIRKENPDWFDDKGRLIPSKVKKVEEIKVDATNALEKIQKGEALNDAEKVQLRKAGIMFKEDVDAVLADRGINQSSTELETFEKAHPLAVDHYHELADLMEIENKKPEGMRMTLEEVWAKYRDVKGIKEATDTTPSKPNEKKDGLDTQIPSPPSGTAGAQPVESKKDVMDTLLGAQGF